MLTWSKSLISLGYAQQPSGCDSNNYIILPSGDRIRPVAIFFVRTITEDLEIPKQKMESQEN